MPHPTKSPIINIRSQWCILDRELAKQLDMQTLRLLERCKRNQDRFSENDLFQMTNTEFSTWTSQHAISNADKKGLRRAPFVFTQSGIQTLQVLFAKTNKSNIFETILNDFKTKQDTPLFQKNELNNNLLTYTSNDGSIQFDVEFDGDTVWLNQQQMAQLFDTSRENITRHIGNVFDENELTKSSVCKDLLHTASDGKSYQITQYNLEVITSVGYRVKSIKGTHFRQWANKILKHHLINGYTIKDRVSDKQLKSAKTIIDNRIYNITIGDIQIHLKDSTLTLDVNDHEKISPLINQLQKQIKGTGLDHYINENKQTPAGISNILQTIVNEDSWFRKMLSQVSDTQDTVQQIVDTLSGLGI